jgi:hypothetical protein
VSDPHQWLSIYTATIQCSDESSMKKREIKESI